MSWDKKYKFHSSIIQVTWHDSVWYSIQLNWWHKRPHTYNIEIITTKVLLNSAAVNCKPLKQLAMHSDQHSLWQIG